MYDNISTKDGRGENGILLSCSYILHEVVIIIWR